VPDRPAQPQPDALADVSGACGLRQEHAKRRSVLEVTDREIEVAHLIMLADGDDTEGMPALAA
jgi:hypothetical protein